MIDFNEILAKLSFMITADKDYREFLKEEYQTRCARNPRYSLRGFARDLDLSPSRLVEVINYKRGFSSAAAEKISERLGLSEAEKQLLVTQVQSIHGRSKTIRKLAASRLKQIRNTSVSQIRMDAFEAISNWYHYSILELTKLSEFNSSVDWIAKRLEISKVEVELALERLKRLGMLVESNRKLSVAKDFVASPAEIPSDSIKKHHDQIIGKAKSAVYTQSVEERDLSATTFAIDTASIPCAKKLIKEFRRKLAAELESVPVKNQVYCFSTQFFRLDQKERKST